MATTIPPYGPNLALAPAPFPARTTTTNRPLLLHRAYHNYKPFLRGSMAVARAGFNSPGFFPDPDAAESVVRDLFGRAESLLYTIADAAVSSSPDSVTGATKQSSDWLSGITYYMEVVLKVLKDGLSTVHTPYAYGFAIILLTVLVKAATFPLTKKQVESAMAMRSLQPMVKAIQERYAGDKEKIQLQTARLYKLAGINPLAGCLPTLATIPVWIGLYRALSNVADEGLLTEGFFWIPSLAGPTTIASRQNGSGISWLFPFVDGHPPLGWSDTLAYLVLPVLLVFSQYISVQIMQSSQSNDPNMKSSQAITKFLPLMIGYFALSVPSGLSLYWFTNNILSTAQQVWLQKLGGANISTSALAEDFIKKDEFQIQKSVSELSSTKKEAREGDKLTSKGLSPGERFKQIKEQEEARRRQKEEEKRKAEEAAAKGTQPINEGHERESEREAKLLERDNGAGAGSVAENNEKAQSVSTFHNPSSVGVVVNGDLSGQDSQEDQKTASMFRMENDKVSNNSKVDWSDGQQSYENVEKETVDVYTTTTTKDNNLSGEDTHQARRE